MRLADKLRLWLLWGVRTGLGLLLLTPLVVTTETVFPYVVGKAVYARSLIEIVFALWMVLALATPAYRPPRSRLLLLLGAGLLVALLAAAFGVSWQRSLWSNYERMGGVIDMAHWFALALVLAAVVRSPQQWRVLLNGNLAVALAVALLVVLSSLDIHPPFYGDLVERDYPRRAASLGNATYQGAYIWINMMLALGFLAWSFGGGDGADRKRGTAAALRWGKRFFWAATVVLAFWSFNMSGSYGAFTGFLAAVAGVCLTYAVLGQAAEVRRLARIGTGALVGAIFALGALFLSVTDNAEIYYNALMERLLQMDLEDPSVRTRLVSWQTGLQAFAERPLLGWGPDNYGVAFGRHVGEAGVSVDIHDRAHSDLIERAATEGFLGLLAHVALWAATFFVIWRAARRLTGSASVLPVFVGAVLIGEFVQGLSLIDSPANTLQYILLLAFLVAVEGQVCPPVRRLGWPGGAAAMLKGVPGRRAVHAAAVALAVAVCAGGLVANVRIHASARALSDALTEAAAGNPTSALAAFEQAMGDFPPLANGARHLYFAFLGDYWISLRALEPDAAARELQRADAEAATAVQVEPENWRIGHTLARLYRVVAQTEPGYAGVAQRHAARLAELAPRWSAHDLPVEKAPWQ